MKHSPWERNARPATENPLVIWLLHTTTNNDAGTTATKNLLLWLLWPIAIYTTWFRFLFFRFSFHWFDLFRFCFILWRPVLSNQLNITMIFQIDDDVMFICLFVDFFAAFFGLLYLACGRVEQTKQPFFCYFVCFLPFRLKVQPYFIAKTTTHFSKTLNFPKYNDRKPQREKKPTTKNKQTDKKTQQKRNEWEKNYTQSLPSHHHLDLDPNKIYLISTFFSSLSVYAN